MEQKIKGLTLHHHFYPAEELVSFCRIQTESESTPSWLSDIFRFISVFFDDSDFIVQQTSGTTGRPKNLHLLKKSLLDSAKMTAEFFRFEPSHTALLCLPVNYIAGKMMIIRALVSGMNLELIEPKGEPDLSGLEEIDFCAMVPMQASNLLKHNSWPRIKTLILGGAETNVELKKQLQTTNTDVYETYGMAETCSHIALKRLTGTAPEDLFAALPGIRLSSDKRGCLVIEAPFLPQKVTTNDCVEIISEGRFRWLGRFDNVINSGGIKIQPEVMEEIFSSCLGLPCALAGLPDPLLGQKIVLIVESDEKIGLQEITKKLSGKIEKKLFPKEIYSIGKLPRNTSFKIDREKLKGLIY